jgi:prepilin-type N-terminal cleavage/methylation domain-containing protein
VKKGFTLIEMMIVIAIIGIIAAVVFPMFTKQNVASDGSKVRQLYGASEYCHDGVVYLQYNRGLSIKLDQYGKPVTCG